MKKTAGDPATRSQSSADFSFEIWRRIFQVIVAKEKEALETGAPVSFAIEVNQRDAEHQAAILKVDLICEPNIPAREITESPSLTCEDVLATGEERMQSAKLDCPLLPAL